MEKTRANLVLGTWREVAILVTVFVPLSTIFDATLHPLVKTGLVLICIGIGSKVIIYTIDQEERLK